MALFGASPARVVIMFFVILQTESNSAIHLDIQPSHFSRILNDKVVLSCLPDVHLAQMASEIVMIQISKEGHKPMAVVHQSFKNSHGTLPGKGHEFDARGHIDNKNVSLSYLNVTLINPKREDEGNYVCDVFYLDENNILLEDKSKSNFTIGESDMATIESILVDLITREKSLREEVERVRDHNDALRSDVLERILVLENKTINQTCPGACSNSSDKIDLDIVERLAKLENKTESYSNQRIKNLEDLGSDVRQDLKKTEQTLSHEIHQNKDSIKYVMGNMKILQQTNNSCNLEEVESIVEKQIRNSMSNQTLTSQQVGRNNESGLSNYLFKKVDALEQTVRDNGDRVDDVERQLLSMADNESLSFVLDRMSKLERTIGNNSDRLKYLTGREEALEKSTQHLTQGVDHRSGVLDNTMAVLVNKVSGLEKTSRKNVKQIKNLMDEDREIWAEIFNTAQNITMGKITSLEQTFLNHSKRVETMGDDVAEIQSKVEVMNTTNRKQRQQDMKALDDANALITSRISGVEKVYKEQKQLIQNLTADINDSVHPALEKIKNLEKSWQNVTNQMKSLSEIDSQIENRLTNFENLKEKHAEDVEFLTENFQKSVDLISSEVNDLQQSINGSLSKQMADVTEKAIALGFKMTDVEKINKKQSQDIASLNAKDNAFNTVLSRLEKSTKNDILNVQKDVNLKQQELAGIKKQLNDVKKQVKYHHRSPFGVG